MYASRTALGLFTAALLPQTASALGFTSSHMIALEARGTRLVTFEAGTPGTIHSVIPISGLGDSEVLVGIDVRPSTGDIYGIGTSSRVYRIDETTGVATPTGAGSFTPNLFGRGVGIDFNPVPDRLRVVTNSDQSLRINADLGTVAGVDTSLFYAAGDPGAGISPFVVAAAYTQSFAGATSTTLYGIDTARDVLVRIGGLNGTPSPNLGEVTTVGPLGVDTSAFTGFDVSPFGGAFAVMNVAGESVSKLYTINLATGAATLVGNIGGGRVRDVAVRAVQVPRTFAVTGPVTDRLISFTPGRPGTILSDVAITGLQSGENILGMDFRPATGDLLGLGSTSRVYRIDKVTGAATEVGTGPFTPALAGTNFGVDFNPVPDRLRVVSDSGQNLRLNPNTGAVAGTDTSLAYAAGDSGAGATPRIVSSAYTQNFPGASTTTLYGIDSARDVLVTQGNVGGSPQSPNGGMLFTVGALGIDVQDAGGFDVTPYGGAFAALTPAGSTASSLYVVNVNTGQAGLVGAIGTGTNVRALAFEPLGAPFALAIRGASQLIAFRLGTPGTIATIPVSGLQAGESVVGLDARPATGQIFALGSTSRLYTIDLATGGATQVGAGPFSRTLNGVEFGFDFNPTVDRLRVVSDAGQNLRLNPNTGGVAAVDTTLAYAPTDPNVGVVPRVTAAAYDRNFAGSTVTSLYVIDTGLNTLVTQGSLNSSPVSPNTGQLFTLGGLGLDVEDPSGFDINEFGGAFAALTPVGATASTLYTVNLATGATTVVGAIGGGAPVRDLLLLPVGL